MNLPWADSGSYTPADVARRRALAEKLAASPFQAVNPLGALAATLGGSISGYESKRAVEDENKGRAGYNSKLAEILANPDVTISQLAETAGDPWANSSQSAIVQALIGKKMTPPEPYKPDYQTFSDPVTGDIMRYDANAADAKPSLFYDAPDAGTQGIPYNGDQFKGESGLRGEYNGLNTVKDFGMQTQAYRRVLDSAKDPSPAGDLALIFNYMKVLDPGSTVREGEFATAQNSGSVPEQIWAQYNKIMTGERLVPEIRKDFVQRAGDLYKGAASLQEGTNSRYTDIATQYGFDPSRIVAPVPKIGILDPEFDITEYLGANGEQTKPIPLTGENADAEYEALPSGAHFIGPDGIERVKP